MDHAALVGQNDVMTERTLSVSLSSSALHEKSSQCFLKVIQNLSSMIFYCLSQVHQGCDLEISDHFDDYQAIEKWDIAAIDSYLWMVIEEGQVDYACLLSGIIFLTRSLKSSTYTFFLTNGNWRNVVSTCFLVASKMFDDLGMSNGDFRNVFPTTELCRVNSFELTLCILLEFNLFIHEKDYHRYRRRYESTVSGGSARRNSAFGLGTTSAVHEVEPEPPVKQNPPPVLLNHPPCTSKESEKNHDMDHLSFQPYPSKKKAKSFLGTLQQGLQSFLPSNRRGRSEPDIKKVYCV
jgi:hypothetical protein